jgi:uncharacterized protein
MSRNAEFIQGNALYTGNISHRRFLPKAHAFNYGLFQLYLDTRHIESTLNAFWFSSVRRFSWLQYRRADYFGPPEICLDQAIRDHVENKQGERPIGPIYLLTHLRVFGFVINPVSFYYGFDASGTKLQWILAEITNTPWGERHSYFLPIHAAQATQGPLQWQFAKQFHVSPFLPMDLHYDWRFGSPGQRLDVYMRVQDAASIAQFDATLTLTRRELTCKDLLWQLLRYPFITAKVAFAIYWQALRLWFKGIPFFNHPGKSE